MNIGSILNQPFRETPSCFGFQIAPESPKNEDFFITNHRTKQDTSAVTSADQEKKKEIDALLSEALKGLTFDERQEQQEVLHGVDDGIVEEPNFVESALKDLESHLSVIKNGTLYETAERMSPEYVNSRAFRLMFLRGNRYDTKAAVDQMIKYFGAKEQLFGREKLVKDITIEDLDDDDLHSLKSGTFHWAGKDRSSRKILFQLVGLRAYKSLQNELRARYFITMHALRSDEVQLRGVSVISYAVGEFADKMKGAGFMENTKLSVCLPLYMASLHVCGSDVAQHLIGNLAVKVMPAKLRARVRMHLGSHMEVQYVLSTYGIAPSQLPLKPWTNDVDMTGLLKWVQDCLNEVQGDPSTLNQAQPLAIEPNPSDVLYVGGTKTNNKGNIRLRTLVRELAPVYASVPTEEKRFVVNRMLREIQESGGRFLQQTDGYWHELPVEKVRPKIAQSFRNYKSKASSRKKPPSGTPITGNPLPKDVIFSRSQKSEGDLLLSRLIKERSSEYDALDRGKKQIVVDGVVQQIKAEGGRFLQPIVGAHGGWLELSYDASREKVSRYFRNFRRPSKKAAAQ